MNFPAERATVLAFTFYDDFVTRETVSLPLNVSLSALCILAFLCAKLARRDLSILKLGTCEASRFDSNSNRTPDLIPFESDGPIQKFRIAAPTTFAVVP